MSKNSHRAMLSLFLLILFHGAATQKRALQAQADVPAVQRKVPCRRPRYGLQVIRRR